MIHSKHTIITQDPRMEDLVDSATSMARSDLTVLICGPTGCGKELFARHIHDHSGRSGPFVDVNCAQLSPSMLEDTLFGHEAGAFTDARGTRRGCFEMADKGTLFLDEIAEMAAQMQAALLRVLEQKSVRRIGGTENVAVDVKVVAATNRDCEEAIKTGCLREDLFYRLQGLALLIPPLMERKEDVPLLAKHFAARAAQARETTTPTITNEAMWLLKSYSWPGNVRELRGVIEQLIFVHPSPRIDAATVAGVLRHRHDTGVVPHWQLRAECFVKALVLARWRWDVVARWFGVHPTTVRRAVRSLDVDAFLERMVGESRDAILAESELNMHRAVAQAEGNMSQAAALLEIDRSTLAKWIAAPANLTASTPDAHGPAPPCGRPHPRIADSAGDNRANAR